MVPTFVNRMVSKTMKTKEKCGEEFDGSICARRKGHGGCHVDSVGSKYGPLSWTNEGKLRDLAERSKEQEAKKQ